MQSQEFNELPCAQVRTVPVACRGRCFTLMTANLKAISFTIMPLQKINCYHCAAAASCSFQFAKAPRSRCHQKCNVSHEIVTGIGALAAPGWISATLLCAGVCCCTQPLLCGTFRKAVHYLGGTVGFRRSFPLLLWISGMTFPYPVVLSMLQSLHLPTGVYRQP